MVQVVCDAPLLDKIFSKEAFGCCTISLAMQGYKSPVQPLDSAKIAVPHPSYPHAFVSAQHTRIPPPRTLAFVGLTSR